MLCCVYSRIAGSFFLGAALVGLGIALAQRGGSPAATARAQEGAKGADGDMTTFGGSPARNMVNLTAKDIPGKFELEEALKWKVELGSRAYGGPVIAGGKVFIGTNNEFPRNPRDRVKPGPGEEVGPPVDKGILMCFDEATGKFLWQAVHDKLPSGLVHDWPREGICSTPAVEGDRIYYVNNRCTVVCADVNGFLDGKNDGMQTEKYKEKTDADIIWEVDMMADLKVFPHNMSACSPLIFGDTIFVVTANGVDEGHLNIPAPDAPSFMAIDKKTGKVKWTDNSPGRDIMHGQWANPAAGTFDGKPQVIFPGGDGWLRGFNPDTGKLIWKFDANPKAAKYELGGKGTKSDFIGTPVVYDGKVYIGTGQDPEHFEGVGHFYCIDPTKEGDISPTVVTDASVDPPATKPNPNSGMVWTIGGEETRKFAKRDYVFGRTMSTAAIVDDVVYISELAGYLHCLDAKTGKKYWQFDLKSAIWGSPYYADGKVYIANEDGDLYVFKHEKKHDVLDETELSSKAADEKAARQVVIDTRKEVAKRYLIAKILIDEPVRSTPVVANGVLYIMSEKTLFAVGKK